MEFQIRTLAAKDVAPMCRILSCIGLSEFRDLVVPLAQPDGGLSVEEVGIDVVLGAADIVLKNVDKAETELFAFLASLSGLSREEVAELSLGDFLDLLVAVFRSDGFADFLARAKALR